MRARTDTLVRAVGGLRRSDVEAYLSASKLLLAGAAGQNLLLSTTARLTRANQLGFLGFGSANDDAHKLQLELAAGLLLRPDLAVGIEYRQKPDQLLFAREDDWYDLFVGYFPSKDWSIVGAYIVTGDVAGKTNQSGVYVSVQAIF